MRGVHVRVPDRGARDVPRGREPPPLKIPEIDENFQTVVPGQYLIGEVAGKPLVKNAANLGRAVVEHMLATGLRAGRDRRAATRSSTSRSSAPARAACRRR